MDTPLIKIFSEVLNSFSPLERQEHSAISTNFLKTWNLIFAKYAYTFKDIILIYPSYYILKNGFYQNTNGNDIIFWLNDKNYKNDLDLVLQHVEAFSKANVRSISKYFVEEKNDEDVYLIINKDETKINDKIVCKHKLNNLKFLVKAKSPQIDKSNSIYKVHVYEVETYTRTLYNYDRDIINCEEGGYEKLRDSIAYHIPLVNNTNKEVHYIFSTTKRLNTEGKVGYGGIFVLFNKAPDQDIVNFFRLISDLISLVVAFNISQENLLKQQLRTAIISILVDSYAHNISAHSLSALQWWFRKRSEESFERKIYLDYDPTIRNLKLQNIDRNELMTINKKQLSDKGATESKNKNLIYYELLGEEDQHNTEQYSSLMDYLRFLPTIDLNFKVQDLLYFEPSEDVYENSNKSYGDNSVHLPFPIDYAIWPFLKYLRDKGAFWSGVIGDNRATPGENVNFYQLLWDEFINNPLYLGTIANSEGINRINFHIQIEEFNSQLNCYPVNARTHFATVDLSLINGSATINDNNYLPKNLHYSDAAFVRLGLNFKELRLQLERINIYLPGGVIGKHALFTIFENTLRNIKHYSSLFTTPTKRQNGIDFFISIRPAVLFQESIYIRENLINDQSRNSFKFKHQLYRIGVWLHHPIQSINVIELFKNVSKNTLKSLLSNVGNPRMGGNAQDKVCAAALMLQHFTDAENLNPTQREYLHRYYYPYSYWSVEDEVGPNPLLMVMYEPKFPDSQERFEKIYDDCISELAKKTFHPGDKYLKKYFHLWKGSDLVAFDENNSELINDELISNDIKEGGVSLESTYKNFLIRTQDNLARFKIIIINKDSAKRDLRDRGVIRIIRAPITESAEMKIYYKNWLGGWVPMTDNVGGNRRQPIFEFYEKNNPNNRLESKLDVPMISEEKRIKIPLSHGGNESGMGDTCDVRSHGRLLKDLLGGISVNQIHTINLETSNYEVLGLELFEILATRILIIDNRINEVVERYNTYKKNNILEILNLIIRPENLSNKPGNIDDKLQEEKDCLFRLLSDDMHIVIIHLSYLESLGYDETNLSEFIDIICNKIGKFKNEQIYLPDNFLLAITTGRGRDTWKNNDTIREYQEHLLHIPIEALQTAIENAVVYKDDFQIKSNVVKVLFGS